MAGRVRGVLFIDYVRMLRRLGAPESPHLGPSERGFFGQRLEPMAWYPMESFERMGLALLQLLVGTETDAIRLWGRSMIGGMLAQFPRLKREGGPREAVLEAQGLMKELFDFDGVVVQPPGDERVQVRVVYGMSPQAEDAAVWQTLGFFEELITQHGGHSVKATREPEGFSLSWSAAPPAALALIARPRVLVVDDERLVLAGISRLLAPDAEVVAAATPAAAVEALEREAFDTVLTDYSMAPHPDGLTLLEEVARRWPHVRRVLHSGSPPDEAGALIARGQLHEVLQKPAPYDLLLRAVATPAPGRPVDQSSGSARGSKQ